MAALSAAAQKLIDALAAVKDHGPLVDVVLVLESTAAAMACAPV